MIPKNRIPPHPGEILMEEFLVPSRMTQAQLAGKMGVPIQRVNEIVNGRRGISAATALLLSKVWDVSPEMYYSRATCRMGKTIFLFEVALWLHRALDRNLSVAASAAMWINLQGTYDLAVAQQRMKRAGQAEG